MTSRRLAVIGRSSLENEHRLPLHPHHFDAIPEELRRRITLERGYGEPYGISDARLAEIFAGVADRDELLRDGDIVLLPKPLPEDLAQLREGAVLWGWPHCVQQRAITQVAVDRRQTLIAWEAMHTWRADGVHDMHVFYRNNEMAGYCGVLHALALAGKDGTYGRPLSAVVLSFGSVSRGAVYALHGVGVTDVRVYTQRPPWSVHDRVPGCRYGRILTPTDDGPVFVKEQDGTERALIDALAPSDVIVNGILQETDRPLMFMAEGEERRLQHGTLIVDVSCDEGMGFPFARPTSFEEPAFPVGPALYYAVNHTPTYLWRAASWELSTAVVPFLATVMGGSEAWERDETIRRAIEIRDGVICNPRILRFQHRAPEWPHAVVG